MADQNIIEELNTLTLKQRKWLKVYIETGNATEAAMQAYDCTARDCGGHIGWENVRKLQGAISTLMDKHGITDGLLMDKLREGLDAEKTEFAKHEGKITDSQDCTDFPTRQRYLDTAFKVRGNYPADRQQVELTGAEGGPVQVDLFERIQHYEQMVEDAKGGT